MKKKLNLDYYVAIKISIIYALFSILWILLSDQILYFFVKSPDFITEIQMIKGWVFVLTTAVIIFFLLKKEVNLLMKTRAALHESEEIFNHFMENSPIYVFFKDKKIRSIKLSKNYEQMIGRPLNSKFLVKQWMKFFLLNLQKI